MFRSIQAASSPLASCFVGRVRADKLRDRRALRPRVDPLEGRIVLSAIVHDPAYGSLYYQPLNGDTQYAITGQIGTSYALQQYAFYASAGDAVSFSANLKGASGYYLDASIEVHNANDGTSGALAYFGGNGLASSKFRALTGGVYILGLQVDYTDAPGPVNYTINVNGADKPSIVATSPGSTTPNTFFITTAPAMPQVNATLIGVVPDDLHATTFRWTTQVTYAGPNSKSSTQSPLLSDQTIYTTKFSPNFADIGYYGGNLVMTASTTIDKVPITATTKSSNMQILGKNPTATAIAAELQSFGTPALVQGSSYNFAAIMQAIIKQESTANELQFKSNGLPLLNSGYDGGVGLMMITFNTTPGDFWNWKRNVSDGYDLLVAKMKQAVTHTKVAAKTLATLAGDAGIKVADLSVQALSPDQVMVDAISLFGPNAWYYWDLRRDDSGTPVVTLDKSKKAGTIKVVVSPDYDGVYVRTILAGYGK